ncbi:MAG: hypothetical protein ACLVKO_10035 [Dysgonomonas sp.]
MKIFRVINAVLLALCFLLFLKWVFRNYGFLTSIITFGLIFLSPWIIKFGHNLWWAFWSFYIPFLTMLLVYEKNYPNTKKFSPAKIFLFMYFAVFLKCFFTGFEFISATLMAAFSPIVYYLILEKETFKKTVITFVKNSIAALMGVITAMVILILQIKVKEGFFMNGINHIINSYLIRTTLDPAKEIPMSTGEILKQYIFEGYPFPLHTLIGIKLSFATLLTVILIFSMLILYLSKDRHKIIALLAATLFSVLAPLSWFLIFKEHAATHPFLNYVVWYIPFLLYGFIIIGLGISLIIKPIINKINKQSI